MSRKLIRYEDAATPEQRDALSAVKQFRFGERMNEATCALVRFERTDDELFSFLTVEEDGQSRPRNKACARILAANVFVEGSNV